MITKFRGYIYHRFRLIVNEHFHFVFEFLIFLDCSRGTNDDLSWCCGWQLKCKSGEGRWLSDIGSYSNPPCESGICGNHSHCKETITDERVTCCV